MVIIISILIVITYTIIIWVLSWSFDRVIEFELQNLTAKTKFTIIIPFRNESKHLPALLDSIFNLDYPQQYYEIIFVDDDSEDNSIETISNAIEKEISNKQAPNITIIPNTRSSNSPKKDAINSAINLSKNEWILTTDADCTLPKYWLSSFDEYIQQHQPNCVAGPVNYGHIMSFLDRFQALEFLSLQAVTIGGFGMKQPFLCNGANFAYKKAAFQTVDGFNGNSTIASGDDVFLLQKFVNLNKEKTHYLKSKKAIVYTYPVQSLTSLIQQRIRWASKTSRSKSYFSKGLGLIVALANLIYVLLLPLALCKAITVTSVFYFVMIKVAVDFLLLFKSLRFFNQESLLLSYLSSSFIYPFFNVYVFCLALFKSYTWKGRQFKQ